MSKLLPNLPIEDLTPENDYLEIIDKGEIIKTFLQSVGYPPLGPPFRVLPTPINHNFHGTKLSHS